MSGHSKWSTIKHKKAATDAAKGKLFSKLSKAISIAIKTGGGPDPDKNYKLRMAIDTAKSANMPKSNIERVLSKASETDNLEEVTYEGFGPNGIGIMVEVATDNRNRSGQEIKGILDRGGGNLAGPGAVSYNFTPKGMLVLDAKGKIDQLMLELIDLGMEEIEEEGDDLVVYVLPEKLTETRKLLLDKGYKIKEFDLVQKPNTTEQITDEKIIVKVIDLLQKLEEHDDVQKVYANIDIDEKLIKS